MSLKIRGKFYRRTDVKMTLWYIFSFLISVSVVFVFLYLRLGHQLIKEVDQFLLDETEEMERVLSRESKETYFLMRFEDDVMTRKYYPFFFQILDPNGNPFFISRGFQEIGYESKDMVLVNAKKGKKTREKIYPLTRRTPYRIISTPVYRNGKLTEIIQLGTHLRFPRKNLVHFRNNMLVAIPIILVLGAIGGWILARRSLSPIGYIASKTKTITYQNLSERLSPRGTGDEMDDLIGTINGMIARLESSFKRMD